MDSTVETVTTSGAVIDAPAPAPKALLMPNTNPPLEDQPIDDEELMVDEYAAQAYQRSAQAEAKAWAKVASKDMQRALAFDCEHIVPEMENWVKVRLAEPGVDMQHIFEHCAKALRLTNKDQRAVAAVVSNLFRKYSPKIKAAAADGVVDYVTTEELFDKMADRLAPKLEKIYLEQFKKVVAQTDRTIDPEVYTTVAEEWARSYATGELKGELSQTTINKLQNIVAKKEQDPSLTAADIKARLGPTFGPYRVAMVSVTEVTRAKAAATNETYDVLTNYGDEVVRRWLTEADEKVCVICGPLDRKLEETYRKSFSDGPPAHPNCRCDIGVEVKQAEEPEPAPMVPTPEPEPLPAAIKPINKTGQEVLDDMRALDKRAVAELLKAEALVRKIKSERNSLYDEAAELTRINASEMDPERLAPVHARISKLLNDDDNKLLERQREQEKIIAAVKAALTEEAHKLLYVTDPIQITPTQNIRASHQEAVDFVSKVTSQAQNPNLFVQIKYRGGRASAIYDNINMSTGTSKSTVVHELGHILDQFCVVQKSKNDSTVMPTGTRSKDYLKERAQGKPLVKLRKLYPLQGYAADEKVYQGAFPDDYTGKLYTGPRDSEVLSMGIQKLYEDPIAFATGDPHHFKFVVNTLRGYPND